MDFFQHQHRARASTRRLVVLFALAVIGIVLAVDLGVALVFRSPGAIVFATVVTLAVIGIASMVRITSLRGGGAEVAQGMGASLVGEDTRDPSLRRLRNVVEEIAIASSVPIPAIYVMEDEEGINAFAAGYSPNDAVIAVTRGALQRLNRDELQGVIAHEFSHILNGDMRLNIRLMGVLFGILVLGVIGRRILSSTHRVRDVRGMTVAVIAGAALLVVGYVGLFFGRLIKAGVSRSREYLADASAVQFTRQTHGIAGALKKIAGLPAGSRIGSSDAEEVSHMLFGEGAGMASWFATHPPILERIKALEPSFSASEFEKQRLRWAHTPPSALEEDAALGFAPDGRRLVGQSSGLPAADAAIQVTGAGVVAQVGAPADDDFERADAIVKAMPGALREQAQRHDRAIPVILALLLDADAALRTRQLEEIGRLLGAPVAEAAGELYAQTRVLHPMLRLPLAALAFPLLRRRPRPELARFLRAGEVLISMNGRVSLFEYCLGRLLRLQLVEALDPPRHAGSGRRKLVQVKTEVVTLLSILAQHGHASDLQARQAFHAGLAAVFPNATLAYAPPADFVRALEQALPVLDAVEPLGKALLVEALTAAIGLDGRVTVAEAELLRTVCAVLHCPLPPMLEV